MFEGRELEQALVEADEPFRTLFTLAVLTGARLSELIGLTWGNVRIAERENVTPIEEARTIALLLDDLSITTTDLAKRLGMAISNHIIGLHLSWRTLTS